MTKVPLTQVDSRVRNSSVGPVGGVPASQTSGVFKAVDDFFARKEKADNVTAVETATRDQVAAGESTLAQPDAMEWESAQDAYRAQARTIHATQVTASAQAKAFDLSNAYRDDPEGFADAWHAYKEDSLTPVQKVDPTHAAQLSLGYDAIGQRTRLQLQEHQQNAAVADARADYMNSVVTGTDALQRQLYAAPNEETLMTGIASTNSSIARAATPEGGRIISHDEAYHAQRANQNALADAYVSARMRRAAEAGDTGALRALRSRLRDNAWYSDPETAQKNADRVDSVLSSLQAQTVAANKERVSSAKSTIPILSELLRSNDPNVVEAAKQGLNAAATTARAFGSGADASDVTVGVAAAFALKQYKDNIAVGSAAQLDAEKGHLARMVASGDPVAIAVAKPALKMIDEATADLRKARAGDYLAASPDLDPVAANPGDYEKRRQVQGARLGVPAASVPLFKDTEIKTLGQVFSQAVDRHDPEAAFGVVQRMQAASGGNPFLGLTGSQLRTEEGAGLLVTMAALGADPSGGSAQQLVSLAAQGGQQARTAAGLKADQKVGDALGADDWKKLRTSLALADGGAAAAVGGWLDRVYSGAAAQAVAAGVEPGSDAKAAANAAVKKAVAPILNSVVPLPNGMYAPSALLAVPTKQGETVADSLRKQLADPMTYFGSDDAAVLNGLVPVPLSQGTVGWLDMRTRRLVANAKTGEPVLLTPKAEVTADFGMTAIHENGIGANSLPDQTQRLLAANPTVVFSAATRRLEKKYSLPGGLLEAAALATERTPSKERSGFGPYNWAPGRPQTEVSGAAALARAGDPSIMDPMDGAARRMRDVLKQNRNDREAALYSYVMGDTFTELKKTRGDQWRKYVPQWAAEWVARTNEAYEADNGR